MKKILILLGLYLTFGCQRTSVSVTEMDPNELKEKILKNGDEKSYTLLSMYYDDKLLDPEFLEISKMMYHKYNYTRALSDIFPAYVYTYNPNQPYDVYKAVSLLNNIPPDKQEEALNYLKIGVEKGDYSCIDNLSEYYLNKGDSVESKRLLEYKKRLVEERSRKIEDSLRRIGEK
ncbi:MAG: hypothetical protein H6604_03690 [Flavobacteriales bacterium]|nr:hypothetical protein [Flavobacteriales bacterium]